MLVKIADVRTTIGTLIDEELQAAGGSNGVISKAEEAAMPAGLAKESVAASRAAGGKGARVVTADAWDRAQQRAFRALDAVNNASGQSKANLSKSEVLSVADVDRPVAELLARAYHSISGSDVALPSGDPDGSPANPGDPPIAPPIVVPPVIGAGGLAAGVDAALPAVKTLLRTADYSRDGTLSYGEAKAFAKRLNHGFFPDDLANLGGAGRLIWEARQDVWRATGDTKPTLIALDAALDGIAARARTFSSDANNFIVDGAGRRVDGNTDGAAYWMAALGIEGVRLDIEPYVRMLDHEGDVAVAKRLPLDVNGPAKDVVRRIVWSVNKAGNDNRWPLWSGTATSRYKLDAGEAQQVADVIAAQSPARAKALVGALADWIALGDGQRNSAGCAYLEDDALPIIEALAADLGVQRSFIGFKTAPAIGAL